MEQAQADTTYTTYLLIQLIICGAVLVLIVLFFRGQPPTPPSAAEAYANDSEEHTDYISHLKELLRNIPFMLLVFGYGINVG